MEQHLGTPGGDPVGFHEPLGGKVRSVHSHRFTLASLDSSVVSKSHHWYFLNVLKVLSGVSRACARFKQRQRFICPLYTH